MTLLEQAQHAVRLSRDFTPKDSRKFDPAEVQELTRLCKEAYLACKAAGVTISDMRLELYRQEREAFRAELAKAYALAGKGVA
jgi:hypothetical protein